MHYEADMMVGGKIAAVGQRLLDSVSRMMLKQGLEAMSAELGRRLGKDPA
jgi:carbon monoxide dehydrogenase subunit G